ncbi:MAG: thiol-disulfide oxidoreductase DCC family protein [Methyloligellaceae bacterium]
MTRSQKSSQDLAARELIVFDGVCHMCSGWVGFLLPRDKERRFLFVPAQSPLGRRLLAENDIDPDDPETFVLVTGGGVHFKSEAILRILGALKGWRWTAVFRVLPSPVRDWLYDRIARNRYRLFGRRQECLVALPGSDDRFLWDDPGPEHAG